MFSCLATGTIHEDHDPAEGHLCAHSQNRTDNMTCMALTDWPSVILVVEVTGKKLENSQPDSAKPEEPWQRVRNSYILNTFSCVTTSIAGTIHDLAEGCLRGAIHDLAEGHLNKT